MASNYEMSLQDYLRVLFKRKWIIILCAFTVFVSAVVYTRQIPPVYSTSSKVELSYQSNLATLLADALLYKGNELATAIEYATSMPVMERAAKELGLVGVDSSPIEIARAASALKGSASASGDGRTNYIVITVTGNDPEYAASSANAIARAFVAQYAVRNTKESIEVRAFIEEQLGRTEMELYDAELELMAMKRRPDYVELSPGVRIDIERAAALEAEYEQTRTELNEARNELEIFRSTIRSENSASSAELLNNDADVNRLKRTLYEAEVDLTRKLKELTPRHPDVKAGQDKVRKTRQELEIAIGQILSSKEAKLEATIATATARTAALEKALPQVQTLIQNLPHRQLEEARLARVIALKEKLYSFFSDKLEQKKYEDLVARENSLAFTEPASIPSRPIYPLKGTNYSIGFSLGLMLGFALAFVVEAMDTSIGTIEDVERTTGFSVLGVIPSITVEEEEQMGERSVVVFDPERARAREVRDRLAELEGVIKSEQGSLGQYKPQLITFYDPKSPISEAYRTLRTNVLFKGIVGNAKTLTVTSSGPQEGKTTTLCNLAVAMAQSGQRVLAVGCNLRRPALHKLFGINKKPGVTDVLIGARDWRDVIQETGIPNLKAFCSGPIPPNPSELLGSENMTKMIREMREAYDVVIFDCPPVLPVTDAAVLSSKCDAVLLVYHVGRAAREALLRTKVQLENVGGRVLGVVLNRIPPEGKLGYSYYYYHYHYYGESSSSEGPAKELRRKNS